MIDSNGTRNFHADGHEHGHAAATWVTIDSAESAQFIVAGYEDGDPEVMDMAPAPLSGEWAGESLAEFGLADAADEHLAEYETGFSEGFWSEVLRRAAYMLGDEGDEPGDEDVRKIASDWHGGQSSPLYAFASTGTIVPGIEAEIRDNLRLLRAGQYSADEINVETPRLSALLDYVVRQTPELEDEDVRQTPHLVCAGSTHLCDTCGRQMYPPLRTERYAVTATVARTVDGWDSVTQVPTFYLDANVQGIVSEEHAERVARDILTAAAAPGATVHVTAVAL